MRQRHAVSKEIVKLRDATRYRDAGHQHRRRSTSKPPTTKPTVAISSDKNKLNDELDSNLLLERKDEDLFFDKNSTFAFCADIFSTIFVTRQILLRVALSKNLLSRQLFY